MSDFSLQRFLPFIPFTFRHSICNHSKIVSHIKIWKFHNTQISIALFYFNNIKCRGRLNQLINPNNWFKSKLNQLFLFIHSQVFFPTSRNAFKSIYHFRIWNSHSPRCHYSHKFSNCFYMNWMPIWLRTKLIFAQLQGIWFKF